MYSVWLSGALATDAALLLISSIQNITEGLDLGIVTLLLQEDGTYSESNCDDQETAEMLTIIIILSIVIAMLLLILLLISAVYLR